MEYKFDLRYPVCKRCGEGVLLPFYWKDMGNVYFCSNCGIKFTGLAEEPAEEGRPVFLDEAVYKTASGHSVHIEDFQEQTDPASDDVEEEEIDEIFGDEEEVQSEVEVGWEGGPDDDEAAITGADVIEGNLSIDNGNIADGGEAEESGDKEENGDDGGNSAEDDEVPQDEAAYETILSKYMDKS